MRVCLWFHHSYVYQIFCMAVRPGHSVNTSGRPEAFEMSVYSRLVKIPSTDRVLWLKWIDI